MKTCQCCFKEKPLEDFITQFPNPSRICKHCRKTVPCPWGRYRNKKHNPTDAQRKKRHGVSPEQFEQMVKAQDGKCAVCLRPFESSRKTHLDHDHKTGKVRGVLCWNCNCALGHFKDNPEVLRRAIDYLTK